jgi:L-ornithine Nalpha-acyltransferase
MLAHNTSEILGQRGTLHARLARTPVEVEAAQRMRYDIFFEQRGAVATDVARAAKLDCDRFDSACDHLLVVQAGSDNGIQLDDGELVGCYRLLRQEQAVATGGFYSQDEFDLAPLIARHPKLRFLELGRSCVLARHRGKPVVELLWQGIWNYVRAHRYDVLLGCASFEGTNPGVHADALGFLAQAASAPPEWQVQALPDRRLKMQRRPCADINHKAALRDLPPLIKGYLRLGCHIGEGAVIDKDFNTIDVLIVLPVSAINPRYFGHFGAPASA